MGLLVVVRPVHHRTVLARSRTILGTKFNVPFFICPAGGVKLAHPDAHLYLTRATRRHHTLHWVCNNSHISHHGMSEARAPSQTTFWQVYVRSELGITPQEVKQAVHLGYKGFALTVDAVRAGKRERDLRVSISQCSPKGTNSDDDQEKLMALLENLRAVQSGLDWISAIKWLREITELPIAINGIQCWEDAKLCMEYGAHPWLSNHGGQAFDKCEVIVDGGITLGADIVKAIALGARAVGHAAIRILSNETETTMAVVGLTSLDQLDSSYLCVPICHLDLGIMSR
ncbi:FMN-dependent dehydrogenase [Aspergillus sergii]|uniref:FMN-dependent dehydrogenase n=1 Tax=Aspergillus sergii TaxID=1034303 RepID=A0A5N6X1C7_9EURO|nr:FMN-dependent dehydrogenase [Aspergillus sergii]